MPSSSLTPAQLRKGYKAPNTPGYGEFSVEMTPQPSPAYSTSPLRLLRQSPTPTLEEFEEIKGQNSSASLRKIRIIDWGRIVISLLLIAAGSAIVGSEGHAIYTYNSTHLSNEWFLPLWPQHFDLRPSIGTLVGGAVVVFTSCLYLICAILPAVGAPVLNILQTWFSMLMNDIVLAAFLLPHPTLHRYIFPGPRGRSLCHGLQRQTLQPVRQRHNRVVDMPVVQWCRG
jgi:hypothetical protein